MKIADKVSNITSHKSTQLCGLAGVGELWRLVSVAASWLSGLWGL